eukprot:GEMP01095363.1.p1 GENE.GEMP01095363.1~~GEMP01095363.1.p1  ORF type:complete len:127 (+),score=22.21 GEMP01095363.1:378-758(+)
MDKSSTAAAVSSVFMKPEVVDYYVNYALEQLIDTIDVYFESYMKEIDPELLNSSIFKASEMLNKIADAAEMGPWKNPHNEDVIMIPLNEFEHLDLEEQHRHMAKILERFESWKALNEQKTKHPGGL